MLTPEHIAEIQNLAMRDSFGLRGQSLEGRAIVALLADRAELAGELQEVKRASIEYHIGECSPAARLDAIVARLEGK